MNTQGHDDTVTAILRVIGILFVLALAAGVGIFMIDQLSSDRAVYNACVYRLGPRDGPKDYAALKKYAIYDHAPIKEIYYRALRFEMAGSDPERAALQAGWTFEQEKHLNP